MRPLVRALGIVARIGRIRTGTGDCDFSALEVACVGECEQRALGVGEVGKLRRGELDEWDVGGMRECIGAAR